MQGNATVVRLVGTDKEILVTAVSVTSRPCADDSRDGFEEDYSLKGVCLDMSAVGERRRDKQRSLGSEVMLEDMAQVAGVRWATEEETTLLARNYYEKPKLFKLGDGLVPPEHKKDALAYFAHM